MVVFLFSAVLTFILYECLAFTAMPLPPRKGWFRIGTIKINFQQASAIWARRVLIIAITLGISLCILFVHDTFSPIDRLSRNKINITMGFLFGPLFAIWLNGIFRLPPGTPLSRSQTLGGIGLIAFCIVGSLGEETGKFVQQWARKVSNVKGFGIELSMSDPARKKDPSQGATPLAGSKSFSSGRGSAGLSYLGQLDDIIDRDISYIKLLGGNDPEVFAQLERAKSFAHSAVSPPLTCLAAWFDETADSTLVNDHIGAFARVFRQVPTLDSETRRRDASEIFVRNMAAIIADIQRAGAVITVKRACGSLLEVFCPETPASARPHGPEQTIADQTDCIWLTARWAADEDGLINSPTATAHVAALSGHLDSFIADDALHGRPYFAIAHASAMVQLKQYEAGIAILYEWLDQFEKKSAQTKGASDPAANWMILRTRSILAAYSEEWILAQGSAAATVFRNEHLRNLDILRGGLERILAQPDFLTRPVAARDPRAFAMPGPCRSEEPAKELDLWRKIYTSYTSMELTQIQNRLNHPQYRRHAETTNADVLKLLNRDLSCLSAYPPVALVYAQILEAYARNILLYAKAKKDAESSGSRLKKAELAIAYGLEITRAQAELDLNRSGGTFLARGTPSDWVAAREALEQTLLEILSVKESLAE
jgi:hypothetical protein